MMRITSLSSGKVLIDGRTRSPLARVIFCWASTARTVRPVVTASSRTPPLTTVTRRWVRTSSAKPDTGICRIRDADRVARRPLRLNCWRTSPTLSAVTVWVVFLPSTVSTSGLACRTTIEVPSRTSADPEGNTLSCGPTSTFASASTSRTVPPKLRTVVSPPSTDRRTSLARTTPVSRPNETPAPTAQTTRAKGERMPDTRPERSREGRRGARRDPARRAAAVGAGDESTARPSG